VRKSTATFFLIIHSFATTTHSQPCDLQPHGIYLQQTRYTMEPSIPSTTDTRSALQDLTAATTNFERAKRFVRIHKAVTAQIRTRSYSPGATELMTEFGDELMAHLAKNVVERQTLLTAASEAYNSSLPPSARSNTHALGKAPDDTAEEKREPKVVTQNETVELLHYSTRSKRSH